LAFGRAPFRQGETAEPIKPERNHLSCADRAFSNYKQKQQPFLTLTQQYREMRIAAHGALQRFALWRL
jgi:hypothetical protein